MKKKVIGGYDTNADKSALTSNYKEYAEGEAPENFIASENVDKKVLRVSADGKSIAVVDESVRAAMRKNRRENGAVD
jgi:hypothetical protein